MKISYAVPWFSRRLQVNCHVIAGGHEYENEFSKSITHYNH